MWPSRLENLIRDDLAQAIALAIDLSALEGTGSSGQPTGILNTTGVNQVANFAAANPTFPEVVTLETAVAEDNALSGNLAYILPASMYGQSNSPSQQLSICFTNGTRKLSKKTLGIRMKNSFPPSFTAPKSGIVSIALR